MFSELYVKTIRVLIKNLSSDFCLLWLTWRRFTIQALDWHFRSNCWEQPNANKHNSKKYNLLLIPTYFAHCTSPQCVIPENVHGHPKEWVYKRKNPCWVRDGHFLSMQCLFQFPDCYFNFLFTLFLAGSWFTFMTLQELTLALMAKP